MKPLSNVDIIKPRWDNVKPAFLLGTGELCYNVLILIHGLSMMRISIIGLGLIGGSLGLAFRKPEADVEVVGYARRPEVASRAFELGAVDRTEGSPVAACKDADMVFIATPAMAVRELFIDIGGHLRDGAIFTDTASTKAMVMTWADEILPPLVNFIGGHPMAGREASGIDVADGGYTDYFYGVPEASARPGREAYSGQGGYAGFMASTMLARRIPGFGKVLGYVRWENVNGAVYENSPLVKSKNNFTVGVTVEWMLFTSKTKVDPRYVDDGFIIAQIRLQQRDQRIPGRQHALPGRRRAPPEAGRHLVEIHHSAHLPLPPRDRKF